MFDAPQQVVDDLAANLTQEIGLFEELRQTLEDERTQLVELDVEGIDRCTLAKEGIAHRHRLLEEARRAIGEDFGQLDGELGHDARLTDVAMAARTVGLAGVDDLDRLRTRLSSLIETVREMNDLNRRFVAHSLVCVQGATALLRRSLPETDEVGPATYRASGRVGDPAGPAGARTVRVTG